MLLTIGMIVKNEEKWLDKCLSAIKPILDCVDSELIITDTGSTDSTVDIAKRYTDKVLNFDWINDFSAARNTGLDNANGEWLMFLDADEIFQSCDTIIDFFNSGEYKDYNSATFIIRNLSSDGIGSDFPAARLTKIRNETRFIGIIHEHLNTFGTPIKHLDDVAEHYGYFYNSDSEKQKKFERNYELLLLKYDKFRNSDPMIYAEMYDTLALGSRQKEADEYLEIGISWCVEHKHPILLLLYCKKARHLLFEKMTKEALDVCNDYFCMDSTIRPGVMYSDAEILAVRATAFYRLEKYEEAFDCLRSYFDVYEEIKSGKLETRDKIYGSLSLASDSNYLSYVGQFLVCALNIGKYVPAAETISGLPIYNYVGNRDILNSVISLELSLLEQVDEKYIERFSSQLDSYGKNEIQKSVNKKHSNKGSGNIVLTIGMIVKNEEKWLDKCLSAIKPILDNVDSELIITDTGSTDKTVEIAKKYTENVLHFDWINDFAAARNFGLEKAKGEWFMMLDADDIFRSCENIIDFFNSGEYKRYNSATYISNNPSVDNTSTYTYNAQRITRLLPHTKYEGTIHEAINSYGAPIKRLSDVADHYGYYYETEDAKKKKFERNSELLLKRLSTESPTSPMLFVQLYETYAIVDKWAEAERYLNIGIEYCKSINSIVLAVLYTKKAYSEVLNNRYYDAINTCHEYLDMDKSIRSDKLTADREIYAILASSLLRTNDLIGAEQAFAEFFDVYEMTVSGELSTSEADTIRFLASADYNYIPFVNAFLYCCTTNGHYETAAEYMSKLPIYKHSENKDVLKDTIMFEARILEKLGLGYYDAFVKQLDDYGKSKLEKAVEKLRPKSNTNSELEQLAKALKSNIRNLISNGSYENARKFLSEYQKINPGDTEIPELLAMIK